MPLGIDTDRRPARRLRLLPDARPFPTHRVSSRKGLSYATPPNDRPGRGTGVGGRPARPDDPARDPVNARPHHRRHGPGPDLADDRRDGPVAALAHLPDRP